MNNSHNYFSNIILLLNALFAKCLCGAFIVAIIIIETRHSIAIAINVGLNPPVNVAINVPNNDPTPKP